VTDFQGFKNESDRDKALFSLAFVSVAGGVLAAIALIALTLTTVKLVDSL
jgi:hypothetical protein